MAFTTKLSDLITKFAPILYFDTDESNLPSSIDFYTGALGYPVGGGQLISAQKWSWSSVPLAAGDYLAVPDGAMAALEGGALSGAQAYVHAQMVGSRTDQVDLQYWIFYPLNGKTTLHFDATLGLNGDTPI